MAAQLRLVRAEVEAGGRAGPGGVFPLRLRGGFVLLPRFSHQGGSAHLHYVADGTGSQDRCFLWLSGRRKGDA